MECQLWVMERVVYTAIKLEQTAAASAEKLHLIDAVPLFTLLRPVHAQISFVRWAPGTVVVRSYVSARCYQ